MGNTVASANILAAYHDISFERACNCGEETTPSPTVDMTVGGGARIREEPSAADAEIEDEFKNCADASNERVELGGGFNVRLRHPVEAWNQVQDHQRKNPPKAAPVQENIDEQRKSHVARDRRNDARMTEGRRIRRSRDHVLRT